MDPEVEPILVLEMIFGAIDSVVFRWLFFDEAYDPTEVADASVFADQSGYLEPRRNRQE